MPNSPGGQSDVEVELYLSRELRWLRTQQLRLAGELGMSPRSRKELRIKVDPEATERAPADLGAALELERRYGSSDALSSGEADTTTITWNDKSDLAPESE